MNSPPRIADRFGANLVQLRAEAGLSQEALSFRAGVHRTQITLMENGRRLPRFETVVKLVGALGVDHGALFAGIAWEPNQSVDGGLSVDRIENGGDAANEK